MQRQRDTRNNPCFEKSLNANLRMSSEVAQKHRRQHDRCDEHAIRRQQEGVFLAQLNKDVRALKILEYHVKKSSYHKIISQ